MKLKITNTTLALCQLHTLGRQISADAIARRSLDAQKYGKLAMSVSDRLTEPEVSLTDYSRAKYAAPPQTTAVVVATGCLGTGRDILADDSEGLDRLEAVMGPGAAAVVTAARMVRSGLDAWAGARDARERELAEWYRGQCDSAVADGRSTPPGVDSLACWAEEYKYIVGRYESVLGRGDCQLLWATAVQPVIDALDGEGIMLAAMDSATAPAAAAVEPSK